jgi:branched-chain amino acid transport system substrate-binding protein
MLLGKIIAALGASVLAALAVGSALAQESVKQESVKQETVKIGLILPMTGPFTTTGKQVEAGVRFYMQQNGTSVAGKKIEVILRDDGGVPDTSKRIAQELLVNDKVNILAGFGLTPIALAVAPLATETRTPMVVMAAATAIVTERSPYIVRSSFAQAQNVIVIADWEARNGIKKAGTIVSDFAPGYDSETYFKERFVAAGGEVPVSLRVPMLNPDFAPFLQRARDAAPDGLYVFIPAGQAATFMRQFIERGLDKSGITLFGAGDITDDDLLNGMGDSMLGIVTAYFYSAAHPSEKNKSFVEGIKAANRGMRPNFFGVSGYDGMHLIYEGLKKTGGKTDGDTFINAVKDLSWESPRGPMRIDPATRDVIHNVYMRKVEKVNGELWNVEFATVEAVKDPVKEAIKAKK